MVTVRREWRGVADTAYDFKEWLRTWGMLLGTFSKDLVPALNMTFYYRWMISYVCCVSFMDKNTMGQRSNALKMSHLLIYDIFRYVAENLVFLAKCDKKNGNSAELNKKVVLFDEMTMGQIMAGFPDLLGIPYQLMPVFLVSEIDQLTCVPYIDAVESFGLPADTCPVPSSECGALVIDALPHMGNCFISSSMPCDGSTMASSYMARRFPDLPVFHLCFPVRYADEATLKMGAEDIRPASSSSRKRPAPSGAGTPTPPHPQPQQQGESTSWRSGRSTRPPILSCWAPATSCSASGTMRWTAVLIPVS